MSALTFYQVDAFASNIFEGNPAAVMKLDAFLPDEGMQNIAMENNLSETAFVVPDGNSYKLRWFTPSCEIDFCGHATIAAAHVLFKEYGLTPPFNFDAQIGALSVDIVGERYVLDAPISTPQETPLTPAMIEAFPAALEGAFRASNYLYVVFSNEEDIAALTPNISKILRLSDFGVAITARGNGVYDCVSRFFAPAKGIDEDPVTGSVHAAIGPYWAQRLGKSKLTAYQASARGGVLYLEVGQARITIAGQAMTYAKGQIFL